MCSTSVWEPCNFFRLPNCTSVWVDLFHVWEPCNFFCLPNPAAQLELLDLSLSTLQFYLLPNPQSAFESIHAFENPVISFSSRTYGQLCMTASLFENPAISSWIYRCFSWLGLVLRVRLNFCIVWTSLACGFATFNQKQSMFLHLSVLQSFIFSK